MARLLSVNVGLPREVTWDGKTVRTAVWKFPVEERRTVRKLNIDGDAQARTWRSSDFAIQVWIEQLGTGG